MATVRYPSLTKSLEVSEGSTRSRFTSARGGVVNTQPLKPRVSAHAHAPAASNTLHDLPPFAQFRRTMLRTIFAPDSTQHPCLACERTLTHPRAGVFHRCSPS